MRIRRQMAAKHAFPIGFTRFNERADYVRNARIQDKLCRNGAAGPMMNRCGF